MRILLIHNEAHYFAGAERVLSYYLEGFRRRAASSRSDGARQPDFQVDPSLGQTDLIPAKQQFSISRLCLQVRRILNGRREFPFDLVHGWTARDWELTSLVGCLARRPPLARFTITQELGSSFPGARF